MHNFKIICFEQFINIDVQRIIFFINYVLHFSLILLLPVKRY